MDGRGNVLAVVLALVGCGGGGGGDDVDGGAGVDAATGALRVELGPNQTVQAPADAINLTAVVSGDAAASATLAWTQVDGPTATLAGLTAATLEVSDLEVGTYAFAVEARAGDEVATDDVTVTVLSDATRCEGPTFYVATDGDDAGGDGSDASPWRTLAKAAGEVTTFGATIVVRAGTYVEDQPSHLAIGVCLEGEGPDTVIVSAVPGEFEPVISLVSPEGTDGHQHISDLTLDGDDLAAGWGIYVAGRSNVSVHDTVVRDFLDRGVIFHGCEEGTCKDGPTIFATGNSFYGNTVTNSARYTSYGTGCLNIGGQDGMLVYDNVITQLDRPLGENGWPIKYHNGGWLRGVKIYDNELTKIPFHGEYGGDGGWDFAIELFNVSGLEIYRNQIQGSVDLNWQTRGDYPFAVHIHDNVIGQPTQNTQPESGIILEFGTETAIIEDNVIRNVAIGVMFTPRAGDAITDVTLRRNLIAGLGREGLGDGQAGGLLGFFPEAPPFTIERFTVVHNTFVADPDDSPYWGLQFEGAELVEDVTVQNNIVGNFEAGWLVTDQAIGGLVVTNNDAFGNGGDDEVVFTGAVPGDAQIEANLTSDPQFEDELDYELGAGSPAIDAGADLGESFLGAAPDLGYRERQ